MSTKITVSMDSHGCQNFTDFTLGDMGFTEHAWSQMDAMEKHKEVCDFIFSGVEIAWDETEV